jgi:hypothetical protein
VVAAVVEDGGTTSARPVSRNPFERRAERRVGRVAHRGADGVRGGGAAWLGLARHGEGSKCFDEVRTDVADRVGGLIWESPQEAGDGSAEAN